MSECVKIKIPVSLITVALMYENGDTKIEKYTLNGKHTPNTVRKHFRVNPIENVKSVAVLDVTKNVNTYNIDIDLISNFLNEHGELENQEV